jgi:hypothetical protein
MTGPTLTLLRDVRVGDCFQFVNERMGYRVLEQKGDRALIQALHTGMLIAPTQTVPNDELVEASG